MNKTSYSKSAEKLLRLLGGNRSYKGFDLTTYAIGKVIENPDSLNYICKSLYVDTAAQFHTTLRRTKYPHDQVCDLGTW